MNIRIIVTLITLLFSTNIYADVFRASLIDDYAELSYSNGGNYSATSEMGGTLVFDNNGNSVVSFDIGSVRESFGDSPWLFSGQAHLFGGNFNYQPSENAKKENTVGFGVSLGIEAGFRFLSPLPTAILIRAAGSPNVVNSSTIDNYYNYGVFGELMLTPSTILHAGVINNSVVLSKDRKHMGKNTRKLHEGAVVGISLRI